MTLPRPVVQRPQWATNDNYTSGSLVGSPTKLAPTSPELADGYHVSKAPSAQKRNFLDNAFGQYVDYVADVAPLNWWPALFPGDISYTRAQTGPAPFNLNAVSDIFWSSLLNRWIVCGVSTAGHVGLLGDGLFGDVNTAASSPPKFAFGCEVGDRVLLFTGDNRGTGQTISYVRSGAAGAINAGTTLPLPGTVSGNAHAGKAIPSNLSGAAFVFGGRDGNHKVWLTSDSGATFTENNVGAATGTNYLDRAVLNADIGRLIAFTNATTANGGNKLWYSDAGASGPWTSVTFTYDKNVDIIYLPSCKKYVMLALEGSVLLVTDDPIAGSLTPLVTLTAGSFPVITAIAGYGSVVVFALSISATDTRLYMLDVVNNTNAKPILRTIQASTSLLSSLPVSSVGVNPFGQFAYSCAASAGTVGLSMQCFAL